MSLTTWWVWTLYRFLIVVLWSQKLINRSQAIKISNRSLYSSTRPHCYIWRCRDLGDLISLSLSLSRQLCAYWSSISVYILLWVLNGNTHHTWLFRISSDFTVMHGLMCTWDRSLPQFKWFHLTYTSSFIHCPAPDECNCSHNKPLSTVSTTVLSI